MYYPSPLGVIAIKINDQRVSELLYMDGIQVAGVHPAPLPGPDEIVLQQCVTQLDEYFSGSRKIFDLPYRQSGTPFQQKVWNQLSEIPFGQTISYRQLAQRLGDAKCIRAAAAANGRNQLNILVPCHRVIGSDGSLTGYGGGLPRKRWLLDHENHFGNGVSLLF
jgi:methylated-DNA-[protein]-cysteine S-methyltransferase